MNIWLTAKVTVAKLKMMLLLLDFCSMFILYTALPLYTKNSSALRVCVRYHVYDNERFIRFIRFIFIRIGIGWCVFCFFYITRLINI